MNENGALDTLSEFPLPGVHPLSDTVFGLIEAGIINAASVGFIAKDMEPNAHGGFDIHRAELLEFSFVAVPSNAEALIQRAKSLGLDPTPLLGRPVSGGSDAIVDEFLRGIEREKLEAAIDSMAAPRDPLAWFFALSESDQARMIAAGLRPAIRQGVSRALTAITGRL